MATLLSAPTLAALGDSYIENGISGGRLSALSFRAYAEAALEGRVRAASNLNFGVSSERIDQIAARVSSVITASPSFCFVYAGTNDLLQSTSLSAQAMVDGVIAIARRLSSAGITPILSTLVPMDAFSNAMDTKRLAFNSLLYNSSPYPVADMATLFEAVYGRNPRQTGGSYDGTHPSAAGAKLIGEAIADTLLKLPLGDYVEGTAIATITTTGTGGTLGTGVNGQAADEWAVTGPTGTYADGARIITTLDDTATQGRLTSAKVTPTDLTAGDTACCEIGIEYVGDPGITHMYAQITFFTAANGGVSSWSALAPRGVENGGTKTGPVTAGIFSGLLRVEFEWPDTVAKHDVVMILDGEGYADLRVTSVNTRKIADG